jgi:hypothetical protein
VTVKTLKKTGALPGIDKYTGQPSGRPSRRTEKAAEGWSWMKADIKGPEWDVLTEANPPTDYPHFMSKKVGTPRVGETHQRVLLLERCVKSMRLGFTRVEAPEESGDPNERPQMASLSRQAGLGARQPGSWRRHLHPVRRTALVAWEGSLASRRSTDAAWGTQGMAQLTTPGSERGLPGHSICHAAHALAPADSRAGPGVRLQRCEHS